MILSYRFSSIRFRADNLISHLLIPFRLHRRFAHQWINRLWFFPSAPTKSDIAYSYGALKTRRQVEKEKI